MYVHARLRPPAPGARAQSRGGAMDPGWVSAIATEVASQLRGDPGPGGQGSFATATNGPGPGGQGQGGGWLGARPGKGGESLWACECGETANWGTRLNCRLCRRPCPLNLQGVRPSGKWGKGPLGEPSRRRESRQAQERGLSRSPRPVLRLRMGAPRSPLRRLARRRRAARPRLLPPPAPLGQARR